MICRNRAKINLRYKRDIYLQQIMRKKENNLARMANRLEFFVLLFSTTHAILQNENFRV